jgi:DNA-binding NtrC family response regulator
MRILVVATPSERNQALIGQLRDQRFDIIVAVSADKALGLTSEGIALVCCPFEMEELNGIGLMQLWKSADAVTKFVILDDVESGAHARDAIRAGAADYFTPLTSTSDVASAIKSIISPHQADGGSPGSALPKTDAASNAPAINPVNRIIGRTPSMCDLRAKVLRAADSQMPVLLVGDSGTGKGLTAEVLHAVGLRASRRLLILDCSSSLPQEENWCANVVRRADGGTIFFDEVGDFSLPLQARVLSLFEHLDRAPSRAAVMAPPRLIAATNRDLRSLATRGNFREDLYYRLSGVTLTLPPLRERAGDIPILSQHFMREIRQAMPTVVQAVDANAMQCLCQYHWPGNVRELRNTLEGSMVMASAKTLGLCDLPPNLRKKVAHKDELSLGASVTSLDALERISIERVLKECGDNRTHAARRLGISVRTLQRKLRQYRL